MKNNDDNKVHIFSDINRVLGKFSLAIMIGFFIIMIIFFIIEFKTIYEDLGILTFLFPIIIAGVAFFPLIKGKLLSKFIYWIKDRITHLICK